MDQSADMPSIFTDDDSQRFLSWMRQLNAAVRATLGGDGDYSSELLRILPACSAQAKQPTTDYERQQQHHSSHKFNSRNITTFLKDVLETVF